MMPEKNMVVVGAGLVGSLWAIYLAKRGFSVGVYEKRQDPRTSKTQEGRSINLALSQRGITALQKACPKALEKILQKAVPMRGREIHDIEGNTNFQAYSEQGHYIHSVGRAHINQCLIEEAEHLGVQFYFNHHLESISISNKQLTFKHQEQLLSIHAPVMFAADGAFSVVRKHFEEAGITQTRIHDIDHGYKEFDIYPELGKKLNPQEALHIWPRGQFMFIALPNFDHSYTGTLFLPVNKNEKAFVDIQANNVNAFFKEQFPDAIPYLHDLTEQFEKHPTSTLGIVYAKNWSFGTWTLLGDAAHGIVPFYGQGMNAGFEDCFYLDELLEKTHHDWEQAFQYLEKIRKPNTDAIAALAMENFIEMRDLVADAQFVLQKKIEGALSKEPTLNWQVLYNVVSFTNTPYEEAYRLGKANDALMKKLLQENSIHFDTWNSPNEWAKIVKFIKNNQ